MIRHIILGLVLSPLLLILAACGGGGGDSAAPPAYSTATLKINLNGNLQGGNIAGVEFTLTLPTHVTPAMANNTVAPGVVTPSGTFAGSSVAPLVTYIPAAGSTPAELQIAVSTLVPAGVTTVGEIATVTLQLTNGAAPGAADFTLNKVPVKVSDINGSPGASLTATVAGVTLQ
jgi:hypothetical protein